MRSVFSASLALALLVALFLGGSVLTRARSAPLAPRAPGGASVASPFEGPAALAAPRAAEERARPETASLATSPAALDADGAAPSEEVARPVRSEPTARLFGRVVDRAGHGVAPATVEARVRGSEPRVATVEPDGRFELVVPRSACTLVVRPDSLPEGWLAPWGQERAARQVEASGAGVVACGESFATTVAVPQELAELHVELRAFRAAAVCGRVVDEELSGIGGAQVRLSSLDEETPGRIVDGWSDADGAFRIEGLHPGRYRLEVSCGRRTPASEREWRAPLAREIELEEGRTVELSDLAPELRERLP